MSAKRSAIGLLPDMTEHGEDTAQNDQTPLSRFIIMVLMILQKQEDIQGQPCGIFHKLNGG
jgi:hypothetical protein